MTNQRTDAISRRGALVGLGAGGLGLALAATTRQASAQESTTDAMAGHPIVGAWMVTTPIGPALAVFAADGTNIQGVPTAQAGPLGVTFTGAQVGTWEPTGPRTIHFTGVQLLTDATGAFVGSVTIDGHPRVSDDGQTLIDDAAETTVTIRDAANNVVNVIPGPPAPPATGVRMGVGAPGFPAAVVATPAASSAAVEGQTATINGAELYYEVHGDAAGTPVLLLHGGIGSTEDWVSLVPALLAAGYRTVAMDCRGRGRSTWGDLPITYEQMAADALALLDLLGIEQTDLVGWSDGAILGLELAIHHPERLIKVVAYGANFEPTGFHDPTPTPELDAIFGEIVATQQRLSPEPERLEELFAVLGELYKVAPNYSEDQLRSITVPILILDGAEEEMINPDQPVRMAELIPGAELVLMPGTGHLAPIEQPDEFNRIVLDFLQA